MFQRVSVVVSAARHWRTGHGHSGEDELAPLRGSGHLGQRVSNIFTGSTSGRSVPLRQVNTFIRSSLCLLESYLEVLGTP